MARPKQDKVYKNKLNRAQKRAVEKKLQFLEDQTDNIDAVFDVLEGMSKGEGESKVADLQAVKFYINLWKNFPKEILEDIENLVKNDVISSEEAEVMATEVQAREAIFSTRADH